MSTPRIRTKYTYEKYFGLPRHHWEAVGGLLGIHLHIEDCGEEHQVEYGKRYGGGFEVHYRHAPEHRKHDAPDHDECWLLKAPCWHDGSSLVVDETWIPIWLAAPHDHDRMLEMLANEVRRIQSDMEGDE